MGLKKSFYIKNESAWNEIEAKASEKGLKAIDYLVDVYLASKEKPKAKPAPRVSKDQEEVAARLRAKMKARGEPVMSEDELREYRETLENGDAATRMRLLIDHQKKMGMFSGRYERPAQIARLAGEFNKRIAL